MHLITMWLTCVLIITTLCLVTNGIPTGGKFTGTLTEANNNATHHLTMAGGGTVSLDALATRSVEFIIKVNVTKYECANIGRGGIMPQYKGCSFYYERKMNLTDEGSKNQIVWIKDNAVITYCNKSNAVDYLPNNSNDSTTLYKITKTSVYLVIIQVDFPHPPEIDFTLEYTLKMKNYFGYLSLIDYPGLIFYGLMMAVYIVYALIWTVLMALSFKDLIHLQFWIAFVIFLGMLEKTFYVSMYSTVNQNGSHVEDRPLYIVAELIVSAKSSLARMLLIIVSLGYGTVKPSLGAQMGKVFAAGGIYGVFAFLDGITRSYSLTDDTSDNKEYFTMIPLVIIDSIILYWVFTSIMETRHILRLRRNIVKLQFYNHLIYMLIFAVLVAVVFMMWSIIYLKSSDCLKDWKELWFDDAFWHLLFSFMLGVIMFLWRPNTNSSRYAYAVVDDESDDYEPVQGPNENFETVKMRKFDKEPRVPNAQLEDDLKWVEENLPSSAVDTILPLIADSDEEMMTTKFEQSKLD